MKPKNFPLRKLIRKHKALGTSPSQAELNEARNIRTKKSRIGRAKVSL